jgi:hypothetical protein
MGKTKEQQLAEVGISTSSAQRYEELAGSREEQAMQIASAAMETYFVARMGNRLVTKNCAPR